MASFDEHAEAYDRWFMNNPNMLESEARLLAYALSGCGRTLSVGCGSGLFESIMKRDFNIHVTHGIEPSADMAGIARKRGMEVREATAEEADFGKDEWDTILFNGSPGYIGDLRKAVRKSFEALKEGGRIVMLDVPKESSYGLIYNLACTLGTWDHPLLEGCRPADPYPIELVGAAAWRTTAEKIELLEEAGFTGLDSAQTLTGHPAHSDREAEDPVPGHTRGDYVALWAVKGEAGS
jgi:SAM-dependent methyltransferase